MKLTLKKISRLSVALTAIMITACSQNETVETPSVTIPENSVTTIHVEVSGFATQQGFINAGLYDEAGYSGGKAVRAQRIPIDAGEITLVFEDVPAGEYGIKLFQDADSNGDLNANAFGIPTEPYAFSNNAKGNMGPAKWQAARFLAVEETTVQSISFN